MAKLRYKNENNELVEIEIRPYRRIEITDNDDNHYEIKPDKFGGIEIISSDGSIAIEPRVSNQLIIKTI